MRRINFTVIMIVLIISAQIIYSFPQNDYLIQAEKIKEFTNDMDIINVSSFEFHGMRPYQYYGSSILHGSGDINGDGFDDLIVGDGSNNSKYQGGGAVHIFFGSSDMDLKMQNVTVPDSTIYGNEYDSFGEWPCIPGDINNDGLDDLVVGSPYWTRGQHTGRASVFFGRTEGWEEEMSINDSDADIISEDLADYFGVGITGPGDINSDGIDDLVIGANFHDSSIGSNTGKVYIYFGKEEWHDSDASSRCDASFIGMESNDFIGKSNYGPGDINGDGIDDLALGSGYIDGTTSYDGGAFLIFGKSSGWGKNVSLSQANVFIEGCDQNGYFGERIAGGQDINGDGFSDIAIGAHMASSDVATSGKVMIFFGRVEGWDSITQSDDADVSIHGKTLSGNFGSDMVMAEDINSDGISDIIIGEMENCDNGNYHGKVYLFYGRTNGWKDQMNCDESDASMVGMEPGDYLGSKTRIAGDLDGDGLGELLISADRSSAIGQYSGKIYGITSGRNFEPTEIYDLEVFCDNERTINADVIDRGEYLYLRLTGKDGNITMRNTAYVNITLNQTRPTPLKVPLRETSIDSGIYHGKFITPMSAKFREKIDIISHNDHTKRYSVMVNTPVILGPVPEIIETGQYEGFSYTFENLGYSIDPSWNADFDGDWIEWSGSNQTLYGSPDNVDVGRYDVSVNLSHPSGKSDQCEFRIKVKNIPPVIKTTDIEFVQEDRLYYVDYNSTEDGDGYIEWSYSSNASFLNLDKSSGVLTGEPSSLDLGSYVVNIWVTDGNGGRDEHRFNLTVTDRNDPPRITTKDISQLEQGDTYYRKYEATDPDPGDRITWSLRTDADWLIFDQNRTLLTGTPGPEDVGIFDVEIRAQDRGGLFDSHEFKLKVLNINDPPVFQNVPTDITMESGEAFNFDVEAYDPDQGDEITYKISSIPDSDIHIGYTDGKISWTASSKWWDSPPFIMEVTILAEDHELTSIHRYKIEVLPSTPPTTEITGPIDGEKVSSRELKLEWSSFDLEGDHLTYSLYLGETRALVDSLKEETLLISGLEETSIQINDLEPGKNYYWTVIPCDGCSRGSCSNGVMSFKLNTPPKVELPDLQEVTAGEKFRMLIKATDEDQEDWSNLMYSLKTAPEGMSIDESSGVIIWNPEKGQDLMHQVVVNVTDGTDIIEVSFTVEVLPSDSDEGNGLLILLIPAVVLIGAAVLLMTILIRKRNEEAEDQEPVKEQIIGCHDDKEEGPQISCDVALTPDEAHSSLGKGSKEVSYEELYGIPAPKQDTDPAPDARALRDQIRDEIENLEKMEE